MFGQTSNLIEDIEKIYDTIENAIIESIEKHYTNSTSSFSKNVKNILEKTTKMVFDIISTIRFFITIIPLILLFIFCPIIVFSKGFRSLIRATKLIITKRFSEEPDKKAEEMKNEIRTMKESIQEMGGMTKKLFLNNTQQLTQSINETEQSIKMGMESHITGENASNFRQITERLEQTEKVITTESAKTNMRVSQISNEIESIKNLLTQINLTCVEIVKLQQQRLVLTFTNSEDLPVKGIKRLFCQKSYSDDTKSNNNAKGTVLAK